VRVEEIQSGAFERERVLQDQWYGIEKQHPRFDHYESINLDGVNVNVHYDLGDIGAGFVFPHIISAFAVVSTSLHCHYNAVYREGCVVRPWSHPGKVFPTAYTDTFMWLGTILGCRNECKTSCN
jgi:hypothetical protein